MIREEVQSRLEKALKTLGVAEPKAVLEHAELAHGDYATSVALKYAKNAGTSPRDLAQKIVDALGRIDGVVFIEVAGPGFINFRLSSETLNATVADIGSDEKWGWNETRQGKKVMIEYTDPNPFKEFHIGHLMANAIGESLSRLVESSGAGVYRANYQGDVGPHVAKAIWGKQQKPELSWGEAYAYGAKAYETHKDDIDVINVKVYDRSDARINELYDEGRKASLEHFEEYSVQNSTTTFSRVRQRRKARRWWSRMLRYLRKATGQSSTRAKRWACIRAYSLIQKACPRTRRKISDSLN